MLTAYITHPDCFLHSNGVGHPEVAERLMVIQDALIASGLYDCLAYFDAPMIRRELLSVHDQKYVDFLYELARRPDAVHLDPDTLFSASSLNAVLRAAGAGVLAVDLVMSQQVQNAFCNVRPPGHHAEAGCAMGFCILNNIAIAAAYALSQYALKRVVIVDFDVHHGNGSEAIFAQEPRVLLCSVFQHPLYPYTELKTNTSNLLQVPLPGVCNGVLWREAINEMVLPAIDSFGPELIFISAGFDGHAEDEMSGWGLIESDYVWLTQRLKQLANRHASGRIVSMLEGGYALQALARSAVAHIRELAS